MTQTVNGGAPDLIPTFHSATLERLRAWVAEADRDADEHATRGGEARALAQQNLADAARHDEHATRARAIADERRYLLKVAESNHAADPAADRLRQAVADQQAAGPTPHLAPRGA